MPSCVAHTSSKTLVIALNKMPFQPFCPLVHPLVCTGNLYKAVPRLRECCRQVEANEVSNSRNNIHQTWERPYRDSLYGILPSIRSLLPMSYLILHLFTPEPTGIKNNVLMNAAADLCRCIQCHLTSKTLVAPKQYWLSLKLLVMQAKVFSALCEPTAATAGNKFVHSCISLLLEKKAYCWEVW